MFASRRINQHIERHIYSFVVEGNLDVIYQRAGASTLSIIRRVCKNSNKVTQIWQDKFARELKECLSDQDFKKFYLEICFNPKGYEGREFFVVKDLIFPIFELMSSAPTTELIPMLKNVFIGCGQWENNLDTLPESKDTIEKSRFALRELYLSLEQYRQSLNHGQVPELNVLQKQFKFLVLEHIVKLLFRKNLINNDNKMNDVIEVKPNAETPAWVARHESDRRIRKGAVIWFLLSTACAVLTRVLMPDNIAKDPIFVISATISVLTFSYCCTSLCIRDESLDLNQRSQQFRHRFFGRLESSSLNADEKNIAPEEKPLSLSDDKEEDLEINIHDASLLGEHTLDIVNAELRTPLLPKK